MERAIVALVGEIRVRETVGFLVDKTVVGPPVGSGVEVIVGAFLNMFVGTAVGSWFNDTKGTAMGLVLGVTFGRIIGGSGVREKTPG